MEKPASEAGDTPQKSARGVPRKPSSETIHKANANGEAMAKESARRPSNGGDVPRMPTGDIPRVPDMNSGRRMGSDIPRGPPGQEAYRRPSADMPRVHTEGASTPTIAALQNRPLTPNNSSPCASPSPIPPGSSGGHPSPFSQRAPSPYAMLSNRGSSPSPYQLRASMGEIGMGTRGVPGGGDLPSARRLSNVSTPEHKYRGMSPFQPGDGPGYSSRRSLNGSLNGGGMPMFGTPRRNSKAYSVTSNGSTGSIESRVRRFSDTPLPEDPDELKTKLKESWVEYDNLRMEMVAKKEEVLQLRQKVVDLRQELSAVNTSKGVLNEACVTGMMDVFALKSHISRLEGERQALERANEELRRESMEHDQERRGLLNMLDDRKTQLARIEDGYQGECKRRKDVEMSRAAIMERLGLELKWVRRELHEKTLRLKKLARTNSKLACQLLSLEENSSEAAEIAKQLQKHNQQLEGSNTDLTECVMQLEQQIEQLAMEKDETSQKMEMMREEHSSKIQEERATLEQNIQELETELDSVKAMKHEKDTEEFKEQNEKIAMLEQEKGKMQERMCTLAEGMKELEKEKEMQEEAVTQMRQEYVQKLEDDTQALRSRVQELERHLDESRAQENEKHIAHQHTLEQIKQLEEERKTMLSRVTSLERHLLEVQEEKESRVESMKRQSDKEVLKMEEEKKELVSKVDSLEKQLRELEVQKEEADEVIRKLKQDIEDSEQQKATLTHQVTVLEWHLSGLYAEKQEALRTLEDRNLELIRLQQDLADKDEDLEKARAEKVQANEGVHVQMRELKITNDEMCQSMAEHSRRSLALEREVEQLRSDKAKMAEEMEKMQKKRPWLRVSFQFKF